MKTDQLMNVAFSGGNVRVFHNTAMGSLTDLWTVGTSIRLSEGRKVPILSQFLDSEKTKEFMAIIEQRTGTKCIEVVGRGKTGGTWANIHLMVYAAEYLSPSFHFEVIDAFIKNRILELRDSGGERFKALNLIIDQYLPEREGKDNKGIFINVSKMIKAKVMPGDKRWNDADANQLRKRDEYEEKLCTVLKLGLVKNWEHLKEIIEKM